MGAKGNDSIVALDRFIQSTRDSGYKSTASAVAELVDNSIQAGAGCVEVIIYDDPSDADGLKIAVTDDGCGMDRATLSQSMRFGGSSRYNSRSGLGRFGMGLPNASLSQAKRVEVYTWQDRGKPLFTYLDVEEIASGELQSIPRPKIGKVPAWVDMPDSASGTVVTWTQCDRLDNRRVSTMIQKLSQNLGRMFRYFIWQGVEIWINGQSVQAVDPLFQHEDSVVSGAMRHQDVWKCELRVDPNDPRSPTSIVEVEFTELPVQAWHGLPNKEKRSRGISNGAGVSVIRGDREVDFGWFFMGSKRRENYDDWWRCEVRFDPELDEAFGITHTKQQIRPQQFLKEALGSYMEAVAKSLNMRVRRVHADLKTVRESTPALTILDKQDGKLSPISSRRRESPSDKRAMGALKTKHPVLHKAMENGSGKGSTQYHLVEDDLDGAKFFSPVLKEGNLLTVINTRHPFYKKIVEKASSGKLTPEELVTRLQLVLMAAARAEATFSRKADLETLEKFRDEWSNCMSVLLSAS